MKKIKAVQHFLFITILLTGLFERLNSTVKPSFATDGFGTIEKGFFNPPRSARPQVLWWWLNSYITKEGVTRDLEAMKRQGIGGALIFDAAHVDRWEHKDVGPVPVGPPFMSAEWRDVFRYAIKEADRLDLELGVSITSGFNAGGPWVTPEYGQQELVWSQEVVEGPLTHSGDLPLPSGPIVDNQGQLITYGEMEINNDIIRDNLNKPIYYEDVAVVAIPFREYKVHSIPDIQNRLKHWALKSVHSFDYPKSNGFLFDIVYENIPDTSDEGIVPLLSVMDLSKNLNQNGQLIWNVPKGKWMILRFGHTYTGIEIQASNPQNRGLAINHLSEKAAARHFTEIAEKMLDDMKRVNGRNLNYFYLDSWEVRIANWTQNFQEEFRQRRDYEITPYLPILAGCIVESREVSNRFLHDYRETIGDCIADHYYKKFRDLCHEHRLQFRSEMATTPIPVDMLKCLGRCDVPVGEFWAETDLETGRVEPWERMFGKQAASAAHIYGLKIVSAEALTVVDKHWEHSPWDLKRTLDQSFCSGINRNIIHTFSHSPELVGRPGYEYFAGTHFNPQITWWRQARPFVDYISRCQFLLQQGNFVADVCFYQGDQIPSFVPMKHNHPDLGPGYDYDVINTEVILKRMSVQDGKITLPDGMQYQVLVLPNTDMMNPEVLTKIDKMVDHGATVIGKKPKQAYGLKNYPECDSLVKQMADTLWGNCNDQKERQYGKGRIIWGRTIREVLTGNGILPDFKYKGLDEDSRMDYIHRSVAGPKGNWDIYFVVNLMDREEYFNVSFRVTGKVPELWGPDNGDIRKIPAFREKDSRTEIPLILPPRGSVFIVFRENYRNRDITNISLDGKSVFPAYDLNKGNLLDIQLWTAHDNEIILQTAKPGYYQFTDNKGKITDIEVNCIPESIPFDAPWKLSFPAGWDAPDSVEIDQLISWTESENPGMKYFSGTAEYKTTFSVSESFLDESNIFWLDLGDVKDVAEIVLNGEKVGFLWKYPFSIDVTSFLVPGCNKLTVGVTNLWPNRMIGDQFLPENERYTFTNIKKFTKISPLRESGLLGPVQLKVLKKINLKIN